jgi:hypothetical protein
MVKKMWGKRTEKCENVDASGTLLVKNDIVKDGGKVRE